MLRMTGGEGAGADDRPPPGGVPSVSPERTLTPRRHDWTGVLRLSPGGLVSVRYTSEAASVTRARGLLREAWRRWSIEAPCDAVALVATELLTNAVRHALRDPADGGWLAVALRGGEVICAVTDPSTAPPAVRRRLSGEERGYGLRIVGQLCQSWGHAPLGGAGKVVWARVPVAADGRP